MSARTGMRMRCSVQRLTTVDDGGGGQVETWNAHLSSLPCRAWFDARREGALEREQGDRVTVLEDRRVIVPVGTDIKEGDRIVSVTDRKGTLLFAGPMLIESIGRLRDHLMLFVREVS